MTQDPKYVKDIRYMTEQEEARERLKNSVDALTKQVGLHVQMEKEPVKMLGGASAVGAVIGLMVGRQFRKTKRVYVDAGSPVKHQKALMKAQAKQNPGPAGALVATLVTFAFKTVMEKVVSPKLEEVASGLLDKAGQPQSKSSALPAAPKPVAAPAHAAAVPSYAAQSPSGAVQAAAPATPAHAAAAADGVTSFVKPTHKGVVPIPESHVEAKAVGTPIDEQQMSNPNAR
ncbi:hypothetical protein [Deinococcus sp.]|uniref:hypothetical protein n=1 Tax=Deinococcus sp. TaxID=47478 RepID=UPI0025C59F1B|nr:hypothetical protein [Deinococcus sp.]